MNRQETKIKQEMVIEIKIDDIIWEWETHIVPYSDDNGAFESVRLYLEDEASGNHIDVNSEWRFLKWRLGVE